LTIRVSCLFWFNSRFRDTFSSLLFKNVRKRRPGAGFLPGCETLLSACSSLEGGSRVTSGGVGQFPTSLCEVTLCVGIVGHSAPVSCIREVYSGWERGLLSSGRRREWLIGRTEVSQRGAQRRLMLDNTEGCTHAGLGTHPTGRHREAYTRWWEG